MTNEMLNEIQSLDALGVAELRRRYAEVFGEPTRSGNRAWLVRRIAWRLQALAEGDLAERAERIRGRAAELARDQDLRIRPPSDFDPSRPRRGDGPTTGQPGGGLPRRVRGGFSGPWQRDARLPLPGTVLTRVFKGVEHRVTVLPRGFEYGDETYRSLSAVAHAITGAHWNGFHFFGLARPAGKGSA